LNTVPWSTHMCGFYHTRHDYIAEVVPFLTSGLSRDEFCVWVTSGPVEEEEARGILDDQRLASGDLLPRDQVRVYPYDYWYFEDGHFSAEKAVDNATRTYEQALDEGYEGARLTGNLSWLGPDCWGSFKSYESEVDGLIRSKKLKVLCSYPLDGLGESEIRDVVENHVRAVRRNSSWTLENPDESSRAVHAISSENELRNRLLALPVRDRAGELEVAYSEMVKSFSDRSGWERIPLFSTACRATASQIEEWMGRRLDSLLTPPLTVRSLAEDLAELHGRITGAETTLASVDAKEVVFEVKGCPDLSRCSRIGAADRSSASYTEWPPSGQPCPADLVVGGILQAATQTPVRIFTSWEEHTCRKSILPAWYADVISGLEGIGVESILILYADRILLSHYSSTQDAEVLSKVVLAQEERGSEVRKVESVASGAARMICARSGDLTVSVCLESESCLERAVDRITEITRKVQLSA
jgi:hypothetical protein